MISSSPKLQLLGRLGAIFGLIVMLGGQTVHNHQVCCESHGHAKTAASASSECQHACCHRHTPVEKTDDDGSSHPQPHNEHECVVCSWLAQVSCPVVIVDVPQSTELVEPVADSPECAPQSGCPDTTRSRGPPVA